MTCSETLPTCDTDAGSAPGRPPGPGRGWVRRHWLWLVFGAAFLYAASGLFPRVFVEGDDAALCAAFQHLSRTGNLPRGIDYRYDFQPGIYAIVVGLHRVAGVPPRAGFALTTVLGFCAFFVFSSWFVSRLVKVPIPACGLALLLFQESYASAYYGNASMPAAGIMAASLLLASRRSLPAVVGAGVLCGVAGWVRLDSLLVTPALALVTLRADKRSAGLTALMALMAVVVLLALLAWSSVSVQRILWLHARHFNKNANTALTVRCYATIFTGVVCLLLAAGLHRFWRQRDRSLILIAIAGILVPAIAYGRTVVTPKYLLFSLPFLCLPVCAGWGWLGAGRGTGRRVKWAALAFLAIQYVLPLPLIAGPLWTHDGPRRLSAIAWSPITWRRVKADLGAYQRAVWTRSLDFCRDRPESLILVPQWIPRKIISCALLENDYSFVENVVALSSGGHAQVFARDDRTVTLFSPFKGTAVLRPERVVAELGVKPGSVALFVGFRARDYQRFKFAEPTQCLYSGRKSNESVALSIHRVRLQASP